MICQKCKTEGKWVEFNSFQYYYCPKCKEEIPLEEIKTESDSEFEQPYEGQLPQLTPPDEDNSSFPLTGFPPPSPKEDQITLGDIGWVPPFALGGVQYQNGDCETVYVPHFPRRKQWWDK